MVAEPSSLLTDEDRSAIRAHKPELLDLLAPKPAPAAVPAEQEHTKPPCGEQSASAPATDPDRDAALSIVRRLRAYTLPEGRIPAASAIVERLRPLLASPDLVPAEAAAALQAIEAELTALGGTYDSDLAHKIGLINDAFPGARLVEVKKLLQ